MDEVLRYFQKGFNYSQDGPGNRLVYHLSGCNLHCPWCSNPEGLAPGGGREETVSRILRAVASARPMFFDGGGLTLTGGEATLQFKAVMQLLEKVRDLGIHTCIETNATHPRLPELFPLLDLLIADYKIPDKEALFSWTGADISVVEENIRKAAAFGIPLALRTPLIRGVNDDDDDLAGFVRFFGEVKGPGVTVEFLRYHEYGRDKWEKMGMRYAMADAFVGTERVLQFERACREAGIDVVRT